MLQLAQAFVEIALRRRGPESLPDSSFLVAGLLAVYAPLGLIVMAMLDELSGHNLLAFVIDTALYVAFVFAILRFFKLERRFRQTMSALLGADICITLAYLPVAVVGWSLGANLIEPPLVYLYLVAYLWWVYIAGFVLARSLSQALIVGLMFVILFILTSFSVRDLLIQTPS
ncbi:MAG: hypothetical protein R3305_09350 [Gammaproteobacteria bacterium]|nr:hypothetical protein [Gammaproteobacteria bacterium]